MLKELLTLLPDTVTRIPPLAAWAAAGGGILLWLAGGRFSRGILTVVLVAGGAMLGLKAPRWLDLPVSGAAVGVVAALLLGLSAYFLHRAWVGALLGAALAVWAGAAVLIALAPVVEWKWPALRWTGDGARLLTQVWGALPDDLRKVTPVACACGMAAGVSIGLLWPRLSRALLFSVLGVSAILVVGVPAVARARPEWLDLLPSRTASQMFGVLGLVVAGTLVQWWLLLKETKQRPAGPDSADEDELPEDPKPRTKVVVKVREVARPKRREARSTGDGAGDAAEGQAAPEDRTDEPLQERGSPSPPAGGGAATKVSTRERR